MQVAIKSAEASAPNKPQEQTGGCCRGSGLKPLALVEASCQGASEDFVPPAAQRRLVGRTNLRLSPNVVIIGN